MKSELRHAVGDDLIRLGENLKNSNVSLEYYQSTSDMKEGTTRLEVEVSGGGSE